MVATCTTAELNSLVARARESNPDLEIALDRLQEARMLIAIAVSDALPLGEGTAAAASVPEG